MDELLLDAQMLAEQYREPIFADIPEVAAQAGSTAVTGITSTTLTVFDPGDGTRNIELPQALGTSSSPQFDDLALTDDLTVGDLATVTRLAVGAGTTIKRIQTGTVNADPGSIAAQSRNAVDVTITGVAVGDIVLMNPPDGLNVGLVFSGCRVVGANTVRIQLGNLTGGPIDDGSLTWDYLWLDVT